MSKALDTELSRLKRIYNMQTAVIMEYRKLGLIDSDLSKIGENDPFLIWMKKIWCNQTILRAQINEYSPTVRKRLLERKDRPPTWEDDAMNMFVNLYSKGEKVTIMGVLEKLIYQHEITPEIKRRANEIRRLAATHVRRTRRRKI